MAKISCGLSRPSVALWPPLSQHNTTVCLTVEEEVGGGGEKRFCCFPRAPRVSALATHDFYCYILITERESKKWGLRADL